MKKNRKLKVSDNFPELDGLALKKLFRMIRFTAFCFFLSLIQVMAVDSYAQMTRLSLNVNNEQLENVLGIIEDESEFFFLYNKDLIDVEQTISINVQNETIQSILDDMFDGMDISYNVYDRQIVLSNIQLINDMKAQQKSISGKVTDSNNLPLPGVTVIVKGTTNGTITDFDGKYVIENVLEDDILQFSFVGMKTQDISAAGQSVINIILEEETIGIEEVVAIGYGTQIKSTVTGAISTVDSEALENTSVTNVAEALQGKISGVFVTSEGGAPGAGSKIYLRGPMSISGGSPLYVVDGVPVEDLDYNFNMEDIESISVLKDASAASIYGAKAAAGVILVTTKRGKKDAKMQVSMNANYGIRNVMALPELLNRDEYIKAKQLAGYDVVDLFGPESGWSSLPDTDWYDEWYNQGSEQDYTVSVAGGAGPSNFYLSSNYNKIVGTRINNSIERFTFRINSDHQISDRLKFSENFYFKSGVENPAAAPAEGYITLRSIPVMSVYDETNPNGGWGMTPKGFQGRHYVADALSKYERNKDYSIYISGSLDYEIIDDLHIKGLVGSTIQDIDNYNYRYPYFDGSWAALEEFGKGNSKSKQFISTFTANYSKDFNEHKISALVGYEARKSFTGNVNYMNIGSFVGEPQSSDLAEGVESLSSSFLQTDVLDRILSQFGRIEYSYADKYLLTANVRRDGYGSKFGPENKYGVFPGASLGWVISRENFMSNFPNLTLMKFRAGYGVLGNAVGEDFAYNRYFVQGFNYDWSEGDGDYLRETGVSVVDRLANAEIQWESVATTNLGLDVSMWSNRLSFNIDYYSRQTKKMLYDVPLAPSAGVGESVQANIGQMSNKGLEFMINHQNDMGDLSYNVGFNMAFNRNKLISLNPDLERLSISSGEITGGESGGGFYGAVTPCRSEPGQDLGQFYGLETNGIYDTDAAEGTRPTYSGYTPQAGDLIYVDQNNDGMINDADYTYIGNPWPKFTYGLSLSASWKSFDVRAQFNGVYGNDLYNVVESWESAFYSDYNVTKKVYNTSFFGDNGLTDVPFSGTLTKPDRNKNWGLLSDYHVHKGSYLRLKNLQIGYTVPSTLLSGLPMSYVKVFFSADNLFVLTNYPGLDPEVPSDGSILAQGLDYTNRYPLSRIISFGINVKF